MVLYVGRDTPLAPRVTSVSERTTRNVQVRSFGPDQSERSALRAAMAQDTFAAEDLLRARFVHRVTVTLEHDQAIPSAVALVLGGITRVAWARGGSASSGEPVELCAAVVGNNGLFGDPRVRTEQIEHRELFGHGWGPVEQDRVGLFRWTTARQAELLLPLWRVSPLRIQVTARSVPEPDVSRGTVQLQVNELLLNPIALRPGWSSYEWDVPSAALQEGVNQVYLIVSKLQQPLDGTTEPPLGVAVREITLGLRNMR